MASRIRTQTNSPARSPTGTRVASAAARTGRWCWARRDPASAARMARKTSSIPGVGDLVEHLLAELFRRAGDRAAAEGPIELDRRLVVGQRPHDQALHPALHEIAPRRREQAPAEAEPLELGAQVELIDFAIVMQAARPVAAVVGVARDGVAERQQRDAASLADRTLPPVRTASDDQPLELPARDDALVGGPPSLVVRISHRFRVGRARTSDLDEDRAHESNTNP